jgi:hypothetical protein
MNAWRLGLLAFGFTGVTLAAPATVIVDIHARGASEVATIKAAHGVEWSVEAGNELLLGVSAETYPRWLAAPRVRDGFGAMKRDEILIRDHACAQHAGPKPLGVVGGYEIDKAPASLVRNARLYGFNGAGVPASGVLAREVNNELDSIRAPSNIDPIVARVVGRVSSARWFTTMSLLSLYNRNSFSPNLTAARQFIADEFSAANLANEQFNFTMSGLNNCGTPNPPPAINLANPIGRKVGRRFPDQWLIVGGHYDSRNPQRCDGTVNPQPGANDNASGCAGVIELARVFANEPTDRSILFMCFSGEEQGLVGSRRYVESLAAAGHLAKIQLMINLDMIGFDIDGRLSARVETDINVAPTILNRFRAAAALVSPELNLITTTSTFAGSDHWWFLQNGVPAVFTWENGAGIYPHYHLSTDLPENMTNAQPLAAGILKLDAAILTEIAGVETLFTEGFEP